MTIVDNNTGETIRDFDTRAIKLIALKGMESEKVARERNVFATAGMMQSDLADGIDILELFSMVNGLQKMLAEEIERVRRWEKRELPINLHEMKMVDVQNIFHAMEPRTLKAAYMFYCGKNLENAHAAEADTLATYEVLKGQLDRYEGDPRIENNVDKLSRFSTKQRTVDYAGRLILNDKDEPVVSFGKHKGKTAREVYFSEPSYFAWIDNGDFTLDTKRQFALLKAKFEAEKKAVPRTKGYTPFDTLGDLFSQDKF